MNIDKYNSLMRETQEKLFPDIELDEDQYGRCLLMIYYYVHTSGAYDKWKQVYDELNKPNDTPFSEYICESNHHFFCLYKELEAELQTILPSKKYEPYNYAD